MEVALGDVAAQMHLDGVGGRRRAEGPFAQVRLRNEAMGLLPFGRIGASRVLNCIALALDLEFSDRAAEAIVPNDAGFNMAQSPLLRSNAGAVVGLEGEKLKLGAGAVDSRDAPEERLGPPAVWQQGRENGGLFRVLLAEAEVIQADRPGVFLALREGFLERFE